jgi:hypothetical protein
MIGEKGAAAGTVPEAFAAADEGPTTVITQTIDMSERRAHIPETTMMGNPFGPINSIMPSGGRWHRKRKNDGALNRVPPGFYPKVWKVLLKSSGIRAGSYLMPREPTISESTPEEFNFGISSK